METSVVEQINRKFTDSDFLMNIIDSSKKFNREHLYEILAVTLNYFLATRDNRPNLTLRDIKSAYNDLNDNFLTREQIDNIITNGYLTHSFNAIERKYIEKYGFDYLSKISQKDRDYIESIWSDLRFLEQELGKSFFVGFREDGNPLEIVNKEVFMTFPGTKTIYYAENAPERFYFGPLGLGRVIFYSTFPMVVGESRRDYLIRVLKWRIKYCTYNTDQEELFEVAMRVLDYYTKENGCISFIKIKEIIDKPVYTTSYGLEGKDKLKNFCESIERHRFCAKQIFTHQKKDFAEYSGIGDLVTLSTNIPQSAIEFSAFPDTYDLCQKYLKQTGMEDGTLVDYDTCEKIESMSNYSDDIKKLYK